MKYDIAIIGAGVVGANIAYALSKYALRIVILEKENDVSCGTTKANSAIIHAGYDARPGTKMAKLNVIGSQMMGELAKKLGVRYQQIGSLVLAFSEQELETIGMLFQRGESNGVRGMRLLPHKEVLQMEPNVSKAVLGALYAPSAAILSPWELCIALCETAVKNGTVLNLNSAVESIEKKEDGYEIQTASGAVFTDYIINAAGICADDIQAMTGERYFTTKPGKGEYFLLDKSEGNLVHKVIFQCPNEFGKGVLITPTVHGNLIVGPNAQSTEEKQDVSTTADGLAFVRKMAQKSVPDIHFSASIRNFAGLRANTEQADFIIEPSPNASHLINVAGIKSPGLSSAPAIAIDVLGLLKEMGVKFRKKADFADIPLRVHFKELPLGEKRKLIAMNPAYGRVICRCETITQGEIVDALKSTIPPVSIDGVKRRCGSGMGRCQGGFCGQKVQEIVARELQIPMENVPKDTVGTNVITGRTKEANQ